MTEAEPLTLFDPLPTTYRYNSRGLIPVLLGVIVCSILVVALFVWDIVRGDLDAGGRARLDHLVSALPFLAFLIFPAIYTIFDVFRARNASIVFDGVEFVETDMWRRRRAPVRLGDVTGMRKRRWLLIPLMFSEQRYVIETAGSNIYVGDDIQGFKNLLMIVNSELIRKGLTPVQHRWLEPGSSA